MPIIGKKCPHLYLVWQLQGLAVNQQSSQLLARVVSPLLARVVNPLPARVVSPLLAPVVSLLLVSSLVLTGTTRSKSVVKTYLSCFLVNGNVLQVLVCAVV
jgi:hypothetical protein